MFFNHPEFLYGLLAVLIPVIIHLFNFRRYKKIWFSNIEFLKNITAQTRKQNKLKHLIVLLLRMLAVAMVVVAFAGPELSRNQNKAQPESGGLTVVYVDNSFSMMAEGQNGRLFEEVVSYAGDLIAQSPRDKRFVLLSNELKASQRRVLNKEEAVNELDRLTISPVSRNMGTVIGYAASVAAEKKYPAYEMYLFSDFQKNSTRLDRLKNDSLAYFYLFPQTHLQKRNLYIDSCWLTGPVMITGKKTEMKVRVRNVSETGYEKVPLKLQINGQQKAVAGIDVKPGESELVTMSFTPRQTGWHYGKFEIEDYPITYDDKLYIAFNVKKQLQVLEIGTEGGNDVLDLFYGSDSLFRFKKMDYRKIRFDELNSYDLIILNSLPVISNGLTEQLSAHVKSGGKLFFIPAETEDNTDENLLLQAFGAGSIGKLVERKSRVVRVKTTHPLFREAISSIPENADLPVVNKHYRYNYSVSSGVESLVSLLDGDDFLLTKRIGKGYIYMLSAPLGRTFGNFASHALFVPVMYGAAVSGDAHMRLFRVIGKEDKVVLSDLERFPLTDQPFVLKARKDSYSFIPGQQVMNGDLLLDMRGGIVKDGIYDLQEDEKTVYMFAWNYDRAESQLDFYSAVQLEQFVEDEGISNVEVLTAGEESYLEMLNTVSKESQLWKLFIIFALLMILSEILVLRFWK